MKVTITKVGGVKTADTQYRHGETYDVSDNEAGWLIGSGWAHRGGPKPTETAEAAAPVTETAEAAPKTTRRKVNAKD